MATSRPGRDKFRRRYKQIHRSEDRPLQMHSRDSSRKDSAMEKRLAVPREPNAGLLLTAGTREVAKPSKQCCEMGRVLLRHGCEFESQTATGLNMPHDRLGADLAFLDEKIEPSFRAHRPWTWGSKKQTSRAQVQDAGNVILTIATPIDPDTVRCFDARGLAPRVGRCLRKGRHKAP
jgi:hypothetical protein